MSDLHYHCIRTAANPHTEALKLKVYRGYIDIREVVGVPTDDNVRAYMVDAGKHRKRTKVHRAIEETLVNDPDLFSILNAGITLVARKATVIDNKNLMKLVNPSIINGAQTQGVIKDVLDNYEGVDVNWVSFELFVTADEDLIAAITIARNLQNAVQDLSIYGKKGLFEDLRKEFEKVQMHIQLSETDRSENDVDTGKLIQVLTALTPRELWHGKTDKDLPIKIHAYNMRNQCLAGFAETWARAHDPTFPDHERRRELYDFYVSTAVASWKLYRKWKTHQGFKGWDIRNGIKRGKRGEILDVADGLIFPVFSSLALLYRKRRGAWVLAVPRDAMKMIEEDLIENIDYVYKKMANSKPHMVSRSGQCHAFVSKAVSSYHRWADGA